MTTNKINFAKRIDTTMGNELETTNRWQQIK